MDVPIRKGYSVNIGDSPRNLYMKMLENEKLILLDMKKSVRCSRCKNMILLKDNNLESFVTCPNCTKRQNTTQTISENKITEINYNQIIKKIDSLLPENTVHQFDKKSRYWKVNVGNKIIPVMIIEISDSNYIMANAENQASLFIMLDAERHKSLINQFNESQFMSFGKIIEDKTILKKSLQNIATTFDTNYSMEVEKNFDDLRISLNPSQFELFCVEFLEHIKQNYEKLQTFYTYLTRFQNTILNSKIIPLGGPSNPDFVMINLLKYLQSGLQPTKFGEVKRYGNRTTFTWEKYSAAIMHGNAKDALILVSTTDIQLEVWKNIIDNEQDGKFRYVLLDKPLMIILIKCLGLEDVIEKYKKIAE